MEFFKKTPNFDFMGKSRFFAIASTIAVAVSLLGAFTFGAKWGIDFAGGTEVQISFKKHATSADVRRALGKIGFGNSEVVTFGSGDSDYLIRLEAISPITPELAKSAEANLQKALAAYSITKFELSPGGDKVMLRLAKEVSIGDLEKAISASGLTVAESGDAAAADAAEKAEAERAAAEAEKVGAEAPVQEESSKRCESATCTWPTQGYRVYEVSLKGLAERLMEGLRAEPFGKGAVKLRSEWVGPKAGSQLRSNAIMSLTYAMLFIMLYVAIRFDFRFGPGGVIALIHDVIIVFGVFVFLRIEVTLTTVAALLTIAGYSINDTIVIFDRIRENLAKRRDQNILSMVNTSVNETMSRTILTNMTVMMVVLAMWIIGWNTSLRDFAFALVIGQIVGTYSTIFIASPIVVWLDKLYGKKKA
jgi:preprotein translocase subunit SecF